MNYQHLISLLGFSLIFAIIVAVSVLIHPAVGFFYAFGAVMTIFSLTPDRNTCINSIVVDEATDTWLDRGAVPRSSTTRKQHVAN